MRPVLPFAQPAACVAALAILCGPAGAAAQTVPSPYEFIETRHEVSVFGGVATDDRGTLRLGPGGGPIFGARYGFDVTGVFAIETGFSYLMADREVYDPEVQADEPELLGVADAHVGILDARARLNVTGPRTWNRLAPFLFTGIGIAFDLSGETELDEGLDPTARFEFGPSFVGTFGGGVRWLAGDRFGVRLESMVHFWRIAHPLVFRTREQDPQTVPADEWSTSIAVTIGATYRF
jgi:hypothetical protein